MLKTSAIQIFHGGNSTFINLFDKTKFLQFTVHRLLSSTFSRFVMIMNSIKGQLSVYLIYKLVELSTGIGIWILRSRYCLNIFQSFKTASMEKSFLGRK